MTLVLVLITAAWNLLRVWSSLTLTDQLQTYAPRPGPIYIGVTGAAAASLCLLVLWGCWRRAAWSMAALLWGAIGYAAWTWIDRLVFQPNSIWNWPFSLLITAGLVAFIAAVTLDPHNRIYFGREAHGREEQDRPTA